MNPDPSLKAADPEPGPGDADPDPGPNGSECFSRGNLGPDTVGF